MTTVGMANPIRSDFSNESDLGGALYRIQRECGIRLLFQFLNPPVAPARVKAYLDLVDAAGMKTALGYDWSTTGYSGIPASEIYTALFQHPGVADHPALDSYYLIDEPHRHLIDAATVEGHYSSVRALAGPSLPLFVALSGELWKFGSDSFYPSLDKDTRRGVQFSTLDWRDFGAGAIWRKEELIERHTASHALLDAIAPGIVRRASLQGWAFGTYVVPPFDEWVETHNIITALGPLQAVLIQQWDTKNAVLAERSDLFQSPTFAEHREFLLSLAGTPEPEPEPVYVTADDVRLYLPGEAVPESGEYAAVRFAAMEKGKTFPGYLWGTKQGFIRVRL